jgi:hypothetical protein
MILLFKKAPSLREDATHYLFNYFNYSFKKSALLLQVRFSIN